MPRRADPERVARAQLDGARRLLANIENGLLEGRDIEEQRARVAELEGLVERLRVERNRRRAGG